MSGLPWFIASAVPAATAAARYFRLRQVRREVAAALIASAMPGAQVPPCRHPAAVPVPDLAGARVAWLCPDPPEGCGAQLDPGAVSAELSPHAGWPPIRKAGR